MCRVMVGNRFEKLLEQPGLFSLSVTCSFLSVCSEVVSQAQYVSTFSGDRKKWVFCEK